MNETGIKEAHAAMDLRRKYLGYRPWQLARVRGVDVMYEFTSYPWQEPDGVYVNARVIEDPTTNRRFKVRSQIGMSGWGHVRQQAFREGWKAGQAYMRFAQRQYAGAVEVKE